MIGKIFFWAVVAGAERGNAFGGDVDAVGYNLFGKRALRLWHD